MLQESNRVELKEKLNEKPERDLRLSEQPRGRGAIYRRCG